MRNERTSTESPAGESRCSAARSGDQREPVAGVQPDRELCHLCNEPRKPLTVGDDGTTVMVFGKPVLVCGCE